MRLSLILIISLVFSSVPQVVLAQAVPDFSEFRLQLEKSRHDLIVGYGKYLKAFTLIRKQDIDYLVKRVDNKSFSSALNSSIPTAIKDVDKAIESLGGSQLSQEEFNKILEEGVEGSLRVSDPSTIQVFE